jgi:hypothetical protein
VRTASGAVVALTLLLVSTLVAGAQDTTAAPPAPPVPPAPLATRHLLALDISRVQPFRRTYDIVVHARDSTIVLGQREVALDSASYAGVPGWLLVEARTGVVPAAESLYLAPELRPIHWSSALGTARLGVEFVGDSIYGATTSPMGRQSIVLAGRPDLLVSGAMVEMLIPLLPLTSAWSDSVGVFTVDAAMSAVLPAELAVIGEENLMVDTVTPRPAWVVALRAGPRHVLYWIDKETGAALRIDQPLPAHIGTLLEYRIRSESGVPAPP